MNLIYKNFISIVFIYLLTGCTTYEKDPYYVQDSEEVTTTHFSLVSPKGVWQIWASFNDVLFARDLHYFKVFIISIDEDLNNIMNNFITTVDDDEQFISYINIQYRYNYEYPTYIRQYHHRCLEVDLNTSKDVYCPVATTHGHKMLQIEYDTNSTLDVNSSLYSLKATPIDL